MLQTIVGNPSVAQVEHNAPNEEADGVVLSFGAKGTGRDRKVSAPTPSACEWISACDLARV